MVGVFVAQLQATKAERRRAFFASHMADRRNLVIQTKVQIDDFFHMFHRKAARLLSVPIAQFSDRIDRLANSGFECDLNLLYARLNSISNCQKPSLAFQMSCLHKEISRFLEILQRAISNLRLVPARSLVWAIAQMLGYIEEKELSVLKRVDVYLGLDNQLVNTDHNEPVERETAENTSSTSTANNSEVEQDDEGTSAVPALSLPNSAPGHGRSETPQAASESTNTPESEAANS